MKHLFVVSILFLLTVGCASRNLDAGSPFRHANNIAVISVMDAPAHPLNNADQVITSEMLNSLRASQKNSFPLQVDGKIVSIEREQAVALKGMYLGNRYQNLERYLLQQAQQQNADYLLVIHPAPHPQFAHYSPGYGVVCASADGQAQWQGYFLMASELWDVKRQEVLTRVQLSPDELSFNTGRKCTGVAGNKDLMNYREDLMSLAKKSSSLILNRTGLLN